MGFVLFEPWTGRGQFGVVYVAIYKKRRICIKTCLVDIGLNESQAEPSYGTYNGGANPGYGGSVNSARYQINEDLFKDVFQEALQMKTFEHRHVMKVIGVSLDDNLCPEIILPLMDKGDLLSYVRRDTNTVTYKNVS